MKVNKPNFHRQEKKKDQYEKCGFKPGQHSDHQSRFNAIYFIDYNTGALFLSNKYSEHSMVKSANDDLISGFLNALNLFINEINEDYEGKEEIREINFKDTRILYERKNRLLVIGFTKKTDLSIERDILHNILLDFYHRFHDKINNFQGVIDKEMLGYKRVLDERDLSTFLHK
jgi:hypothetical protein